VASASDQQPGLRRPSGLVADGQRIAFISDRDGPFQLYVMPAGGGAQQRLTNGLDEDNTPAGQYAPTWSPDSSAIAFTGDNDPSVEIRASGGTVGVLPGQPVGFEPDWQPGGSAPSSVTAAAVGVPALHSPSPTGGQAPWSGQPSTPWLTCSTVCSATRFKGHRPGSGARDGEESASIAGSLCSWQPDWSAASHDRRAGRSCALPSIGSLYRHVRTSRTCGWGSLARARSTPPLVSGTARRPLPRRRRSRRPARAT
jgi:WD40-like Beta Propeller Repeat